MPKHINLNKGIKYLYDEYCKRGLRNLVPSCFYFLNVYIDKCQTKLYNILQDKAMNGKSRLCPVIRERNPLAGRFL
jgi:hypothetical protein